MADRRNDLWIHLLCPSPVWLTKGTGEGFRGR
jgi:hypothetical protein